MNLDIMKISDSLYGEGKKKDNSPAPPAEKGFFEKIFGSEQKLDIDHVLVSEYEVSSPLFLAAETSKNTMEGMATHIMRLERYLEAGKHLETEKRHYARISDFDGFMRGNPYPRMYVKQ